MRAQAHMMVCNERHTTSMTQRFLKARDKENDAQSALQRFKESFILKVLQLTGLQYAVWWLFLSSSVTSHAQTKHLCRNLPNVKQ